MSKSDTPETATSSDTSSSDAPNAAPATSTPAPASRMRSTSAPIPLPKLRIALLVCVGLAVVTGTLAALNRSNLPALITRVPFADAHGPVMIFGFLGTAICLERAVAFETGGETKPRWGFGAPVCGVLGTLSVLGSVLAGQPYLDALARLNDQMSAQMSTHLNITLGWWTLPGLFWTAQLVYLSAVYLAIWRRQNSISVLIQLLAAVSGALGAFLWMTGTSAAHATPWWLMFLVLSIVGERLELSHVSFVASWVEPALISLSGAILAALAVLNVVPTPGYVLLGVLLVALLLVMLYNDTAVRTFRLPKFTGFMGRVMLSAYVWGLVAGLVWIFARVQSDGLWADVAIHALALGFALSMVVAHVSIIVPAITRRSLPYSPLLYVPWALISLGVAVRLLGAALSRTRVWQAGDLVSILAVVMLMLCILSAAIVSRQRRKKRVRAASPRGPVRRETHARIGRRQDASPFLARAYASVLAECIVLSLCVVLPVARPDVFSSANSTSTASVATGQTTTLRISAQHMAFDQTEFTVPAGDRVVVQFTNRDTQAHDVVFSSGARSPQAAPGQSVTVDLGVVSEDVTGWCSVSGHREMGMEFHIRVNGGAPALAQPQAASSVPSAAQLRTAADSFPARSADIPDYTPERRITLTIREGSIQLTDDFSQKVWQYGDSTPGPVLRGRVGDTFHVTLKNETDMQHNVDFHAGVDGSPDEAMALIDPGQSHEYTFTAKAAGAWLYHCSSMPMGMHMANGMVGAVIIEPREGLPQVDHEYVLVQSEMYLGENGGAADAAKVSAATPDIVQFNGRPFQYAAHPLEVTTGQKVRIWLVNAGPNLDLAFHIVGAQFSTVWKEGRYLIHDAADTASQTVDMTTASGAFVETTFSAPGTYTFLNHKAAYAEKGAQGIIEVKG